MGTSFGVVFDKSEETLGCFCKGKSVLAMRSILIVGASLTLAATVVIGHAYSQGVDTEFEVLPVCNKLDAIANTGKSVSSYIAGSGFDEFAAAVVNDCPRHLVELGRAWELAANRDAEMFERLPVCEKLHAIKSDGKSVADYIEAAGYEAFARSVLERCPRHLEELGIAWQKLNAQGPNTSEDPSNFTPEPDPVFAALPPCRQLDVIEDENKSVPRYIAESGIEDFEAAIRETCPRHVPSLNQAFEIAGLDPAFEALAPCQQLDVIRDSGKSVPQYIADSGIEDFYADVTSMCSRHFDNLMAAQRIIEGSR